MDNFFRYVMSDSKDIAFTELRERLLENYREHFGDVGENAIMSFAGELVGQARSEFDKMTSESRAKLLLASESYEAKMVQSVVNKALRKFKSEVAKIGTDEINSMLSNFRATLSREINSRMTSLLASQDDSSEQEAQILPYGTKFHLCKGDYDILVIEQSPQIRSVRINHDFSGNRKKNYFNLAFPYIVFVLAFRNESLDTCSVFYRNRSIKSLNDMLFSTNLSNVHDSCEVCLWLRNHQVDGLANRANEVISHFWTSEFNSDLDSRYDYYARREPQLGNFKEWEKNSKKDPMFMLNVEWYEKFTLHSCVTGYIDNIPEFSKQFGEDEINAAFTVTEDDMREALMKKFGKIKVRNKYPDIISTTIQKQRKEVINQSFNNVVTAFKCATESESLDKSFQDVIDKSMRETLEHDFQYLAGEVLIRRRIEPDTLIENIREGR